MSDPSFQAEEAPPPRPPRPTQQPRSQLEQDEIYARQLAEHYQSNYDGQGPRSRGDGSQGRRRQEQQDLNDERTFLDGESLVLKSFSLI